MRQTFSKVETISGSNRKKVIPIMLHFSLEKSALNLSLQFLLIHWTMLCQFRKRQDKDIVNDESVIKLSWHFIKHFPGTWHTWGKPWILKVIFCRSKIECGNLEYDGDLKTTPRRSVILMKCWPLLLSRLAKRRTFRFFSTPNQ